MSNNPTPKAVNSKPSYPTVTIFLENCVDLFIARSANKPELNRVIETTPFENGTQVKLLMVPLDTYRFHASIGVDLGPGVECASNNTKVTYATVSLQGNLIPIPGTTTTGFTAVSTNNSLCAEVYDKLIDQLTLGNRLINVNVNHPLNLRDMSKNPTAHIGNGMLLYKVDFKYVSGKMVITSCTPLTVAEAKVYAEGGIEHNTFLLRQHVRDSKTLQVAFNTEFGEGVDFVSLSMLLSQAVPEATITRKGDRYNINPNLETFLK